MIIDVEKYLFFGVKEDLDKFFESAQQQGCIEFIAPSGKKIVAHPSEVQTLLTAIKILRKQPVKHQLVRNFTRGESLECAERILHLKSDSEKLSEEKRLLEAEISRVAPFGDFSLDDLDYIETMGKREIQFFCMRTEISLHTTFPSEVIYIGTEYDLDYFVAINPETKQYPGMIEMRIDRPLGELQSSLIATKESLHEIGVELKGFASHITILHEALIDFLNDHNLSIAKKEVSFSLGSSLFAVEAWIPKNKVATAFNLLEGLSVHCELIEIEKTDQVPTYMENRGIPRIGEDLVSIYDVPATTDKDPSGWVFWAFAVFFAIIVADGGYGLLYLGIALYVKYKFPDLSGLGKRFLKLVMILATSCIIWGVLTASFFGLKIDPKSSFGRLSFTLYLAERKAEYHFHLKDDVYQFWTVQYPHIEAAEDSKQFLHGATTPTHSGNGVVYKMINEFTRSILLEVSLILGVIHLSLAFLRNLWRHWAGVGWITFLIGGYLFFPSILKATSLINILGWVDKEISSQVGLQLVYGGISVAVLLALVQKRLRGVAEITHVVQVFGNVLSYLRLYALGLAGTIMAETFNELGAAVGLALGGIVILIGHGINISLGIMAGTIHGLRLNFIEWYQFCFEGGGRLLKPLLRLKPKE